MEKQLQPILRFPEFKGEWKKMNLGEISKKIGSGKTPLGGEKVYSKDGIPFIRSQNVNYDRLIIDDVHIPVEVHNSMLSSKVFPNDILINITGASIGRTCVVPNDFIEGNVNQHVCIIRLKDDNSNFIQRILSSVIGQKLIYQTQTGSGREGLNFESIKSFKINLPSLTEQQKIADYLSTIDEKLTLLEEKKTELSRYKKAMMQKLFSQEIRFKDANGNDFSDWEEKRLGEIGFFQTSSIDKLIKDNEKEIFLINYMNVYRHEKIDNNTILNFQRVTAKENQIKSCNILKGDILFTPSSETPSDIGHSVVIFEDIPDAVFSYHLMRFRPNIKLDLMYSHYFCNIPKVLNQLTKYATGSTRFTISVKSFSKILVDIPSLSEQQKIADFLSAIDTNITKVEEQIKETQNFKKAMLQQMFV